MKTQKLNKMQTSFNKAILFFACLFAVINLNSQEVALSNSSELAQASTSYDGPFTLQKETSEQRVEAQQTQPETEVKATSNVKKEEKADSTQTDSTFCRHEISIWGAGGLSTLFYDPDFDDRSPKLGGAFGLGYTFYFSKNFGVLIGAELAFYNAKIEVDGLTDNYETYDRSWYVDPNPEFVSDVNGERVNYRSRVDNYEEKQRMMNVNIPLALQYQTSGKHKFFASLGFKLGIPVKGKYEVSDDAVFTTSGYYYNTNQELKDQIDLGYGRFENRGFKEDVDFKLSYMGTVEAGVKWRLSSRLSLYTGAYFEYGFNNVIDKDDNQFVEYNQTNPKDFSVNPTLTSQFTRDGGSTESFADRVAPLAVGLKVRLGVNLCKKPKEAKEEEEQQEQEPEAQEEPKSSRAEAKAIIAARDAAEAYTPLPDEEMEEDLRRAIAEYGPVKGVVAIELEGYEIDQSVMSERMERILNEKVDQLKKAYGVNVLVICEGHTCDLGSEEYNMALGLKRAEKVRNFLIGKGYNPDNVYAVSKGESSPIVPNTDEVNRKKNRRVVLVVRDLE